MTNKNQSTGRKTNKPQPNDFEDALISGELINIYFNQFTVITSVNDVAIVVRRNGKNEAVLNLSHVTARAFADFLTRAIDDFEQATNQKIIADGLLVKPL
jgi:hypothetical protein